MTHRKNKLFVHLLMAVLIVAIASPLAGCGRKSAPERPDDSEYPRSYPAE